MDQIKVKEEEESKKRKVTEEEDSATELPGKEYGELW